MGSNSRIAKTTSDFKDQNLEAAVIILADVDRFGGEQSLSVRWARLFMARRQRERDGAQGRLLEVA